MEKNVLIVAYYYPPVNNGGTRRPASFAKHLKKYGYKPMVVTHMPIETADSEAGVFRFRDPGLELSVSNTIVSYGFRGMRKLLYLTGIIWGYSIWWYREVIYGISVIINKHKPKVIFATFPPQENMMIGLEVAKRFGIPLVLDFRDGMVYEPLQKENFLVRMRRKKLEAMLVDSASKITTVTEPITSYFMQNYPSCDVITISNGFDPEEWLDVKLIELGKTINFVYTGRLSGSRRGISILPLIEAAEALTDAEKKMIKFHMVGEFTNHEIYLMQNHSKSNLFNILGLVDRKIALSYQYSADILILVTDLGQSSVATGKLFEYLAANKPIIGLTSGTMAEEIINKTGTGVCLSPLDIGKITILLSNIINNYPKIDFYKPNDEEIAKYDRSQLSSQLASTLDQAISEFKEKRK